MSDADSQKKDFTLSRAKAAVLSRDFDLAARLYKNLLRVEPDNLEILHELAAMYVRGGQDEKALSVYEQILQNKGDDFQALTSLGGIYRRLERYDDSISVLDKALAIDPNNVQVHYNLGFTYKLMGMYQDALECFSIVIGSNPNDILAYNQQGSIHSLMGDSASAIASYRRGLQLDQNHPVLHFNLARELERLGRDDEAGSEYEAALRAKPGWSDALNGYALFLMAHDRNAEAYELLQRGIKVSPDDNVLQNSMGMLQLRRGEYSDAESRFQSVLSRNSLDEDALFGLADVYSKEDKPEKADGIFERIRARPPQTEDGQVRYARALLNARHLNEGGNLIKKLWDSNRSSVEVMNLVAEYYASLNDIPRLKALLRRMDSADSEYYRHYLDIAERFRQNGNIDEAQLYLRQYLEHRPDDSSALMALAACYEMLQKYSDALALYRRALAKDKGNTFLQGAVMRTGKNLPGVPAGESSGDDLPQDSAVHDVPGDGAEGIPSAFSAEAQASSLPQDGDGFSDEGEVELASEPLFDDFSPLQVEPHTEEEDEMIFNLDGLDDAFSKQDDVYDPLALEPMDLEPIEDEAPNLDALAFDGAPVDYEPSAAAPAFDEDGEGDSLMPSGLSFEDEELELGDDIATASAEVPSAAPEPELSRPAPPEPPRYIPPQYPAWTPPPPPAYQEPPFRPAPPPESAPVHRPPGPDASLEPELPIDAGSDMESELPLDAGPLTDEARRLLPELLDGLSDSGLAERCGSAAGLFRHMRNMCDFLPPLQKEAFLSGKKHIQLDYIIERLTGRPGLLASAEAIRRKGLVEIPQERYDIVEKFDEAAVTGRVLSFMRGMVQQLPDKNIASALDNAVTDILGRLAVRRD